MTKAIVMAGGKVKKNLEDLERRIVDKHYKDKYLLGKGYKPLKKVRIKRGTKKQPLIHYVLSALDETKLIEDITIVGEKNRLDKFLLTQNYNKKIKTIQQKGSLLENALYGYEESNAKNHSLFVASDIPKITSFSINDFISRCKQENDIYFPIIGWETAKMTKKRPPFKLIDNKKTKDKIYDKYGRRGFRMGNMLLADPKNIGNKEIIDLIYNVRKLLIPKNLKTIYRYTKTEIKKYFRKKLSLEDFEYKMSNLLDAKCKLIEIYSTEIEEDMDSETDIQNLEDNI